MRPADCICGARYVDMRTGLTFAQVRRMMWVGSEDTRDWRYKRRNSVLGYWHGLKKQLWYLAHGPCEQEYGSGR